VRLTTELSMSPLRRRMIEDMQIRNLTPNTQRVYVAQVVRFACHFGKSPDLLGPPEIRVYLLHLTQERHLAASSVIVTVSALRFFYHTTLKRPWVVEDDIPTGRQAKKLPVVLSREQWGTSCQRASTSSSYRTTNRPGPTSGRSPTHPRLRAD